MRDFAVFIVRVVVGDLLAGHGAQKLFGSFGGPGMEGFAGFMESMGMKPGKPWAAPAGASEFGGGMLTALGLLNPLGPLGILKQLLADGNPDEYKGLMGKIKDKLTG